MPPLPSPEEHRAFAGPMASAAAFFKGLNAQHRTAEAQAKPVETEEVDDRIPLDEFISAARQSLAKDAEPVGKVSLRDLVERQ